MPHLLRARILEQAASVSGIRRRQNRYRIVYLFTNGRPGSFVKKEMKRPTNLFRPLNGSSTAPSASKGFYLGAP